MNVDNESDDESSDEMKKIKLPKKPKDANSPKKPLSGYFLFQNVKRNEFKKANPNCAQTDLCKKAGAEWKKMSAAQKEKYEKQSKRQKQKYETEFAEYQKTQNYKDWLQKVEEWKAECEELKKSGSVAVRQAKRGKKRKAEVVIASEKGVKRKKRSDKEEMDENEESEQEEDDENDDQNEEEEEEEVAHKKKSKHKKSKKH